ncbi:MAG: DUF2177 family protein [Hyphomicrobiaceae bacterium]
MKDEARVSVAAATSSLVTFVVLDAAWIYIVAIGLFQTHLGQVLRVQPLVVPIIAFYLVYMVGLHVLAVRPALAAQSWVKAAWLGAVLGFVAYATFDLTNLAVIEGWTVDVAAADIAWGTVVSAIAAVAGFAAGRRMQPY